jgi:predicted deacylase
MKTIQQKDEKRHGRARSDGQMRDAMTTASMSNKHITKAMQQSIRELEKNGFLVRRILPVDPMAGVHAREFRADFAKQTPTGLLLFSVRIDTDGNVTNPKP